MNKKIVLTVIVILLTTFSFGCKRLGPTAGQTSDPITPWEMDYHKGTSGLEMVFVENQPPKEIWEGSNFRVALELRNKGATDIDKVLLYASGFKYISLNEQYRPLGFAVAGKTQFNPEGGLEFANLPALAGPIKDIDKTDSFIITACYQYKTDAGIQVCINPNILDIAGIKGGECKPGTVTSSGGQGAPVAVTKVETNFIPVSIPLNEGDITKTKVLFKIYISNKGGGKVIKYSAFDKECIEKSPLDIEKELNVIEVKDISFSKYMLDTKKDNYDTDFKINCIGFMDESTRTIKIPASGEVVLTCDAILFGNDVYTTPLVIELLYGYTSYVNKEIIIKNIPE